MISRRSKFNLLNEIVFCPRLLLFDPQGQRSRGREGWGEAQECPGARREGVSLMGGCRPGQERSSLQGRGTHARRARYPGRAQPSLADAALNPAQDSLTGPATLLALRPLLAVGTRQTRSTRSLRHTQSGTGRGRRREGLAWAFWVLPNCCFLPRVPSPTWDSSGGSEAFPLLGARVEGGGGAAFLLRGNQACVNRSSTILLDGCPRV